MVTIPQGAGWYVIKEAEPFDSLIKRIFLNPKDYNFEVMRAINTHLPPGPLMLQPGQVVIVALERNNAKVKRMMAEAKQAQAEWQKYAMFSSAQKTLLANLPGAWDALPAYQVAGEEGKGKDSLLSSGAKGFPMNWFINGVRQNSNFQSVYNDHRKKINL